jgi:hypothetical protein
MNGSLEVTVIAFSFKGYSREFKKYVPKDSENSVFYIKTLDASGMPLPLRTFDYTERMPAQAPMPSAQNEAQFNPGEFVTRKEFEAAMAQFRAPAENGAVNG